MTPYELPSLISSYGSLLIIYYGIRVMVQGAEMRSADSERKHDDMTRQWRARNGTYRGRSEE